MAMTAAAFSGGMGLNTTGSQVWTTSDKL